MPTEIITAFLTQGLTKDEFDEIVIPARTFKHRRTPVKALSVNESDKPIRAARILARAEDVFEPGESAVLDAKT